MRRWLPLPTTALLAIAPVALASGIMGGDTPTRIPVPAALYCARVTDMAGVTLDLKRVTFDGEILVGGKLGLGNAAIPFERIAVVRVEPTGDPDTRILWVKLHDGSSARVVVDSGAALTGEAVFGNYRIEAKDLSKVEILR
jgi:hypothetical protein